MGQTFATLLGTAVIVALGVDAMQQNLLLALQNMTVLIQDESAKVQRVLDARLRHVEEKLNSR